MSDIQHYKLSGGTVDEMFWLQDNGYRFKPDTSNPTNTIATPPQPINVDPQIKHYYNGRGNESESKQMRIVRLTDIKNQVLRQRAVLIAQSTTVQHPTQQ